MDFSEGNSYLQTVKSLNWGGVPAKFREEFIDAYRKQVRGLDLNIKRQYELDEQRLKTKEHHDSLLERIKDSMATLRYNFEQLRMLEQANSSSFSDPRVREALKDHDFKRKVEHNGSFMLSKYSGMASGLRVHYIINCEAFSERININRQALYVLDNYVKDKRIKRINELEKQVQEIELKFVNKNHEAWESEKEIRNLNKQLAVTQTNLESVEKQRDRFSEMINKLQSQRSTENTMSDASIRSKNAEIINLKSQHKEQLAILRSEARDMARQLQEWKEKKWEADRKHKEEIERLKSEHVLAMYRQEKELAAYSDQMASDFEQKNRQMIDKLASEKAADILRSYGIEIK
jgi:hypothetical protein